MATIDVKKDGKGNVTGYRFRACVGRDEKGKQIWRTLSVDRPEGLTPAKEKKEVERQADAWEQSEKEKYERTQEKQDKSKITLSAFIDEHWQKDHVLDGSHTPSSISFYQYMAEDIKSYFGDKKRLNQIDAETVKRYIRYLNTEARLKVNDYKEIPVSVMQDDEGATLTWKAEKDALSYQIWRKGRRGKKFEKIASTKELTYRDEKTGNYNYQVKARFERPGEEPYSKTTVIRHYQTFRNVLNYALRFGYLKEDPCKYLSVKDKPKKENKTVDFLPPAEAKRYIACLDQEPFYWNCLQNVLITTGLRRGECVGLQWGDIDKDKLTMTIKRNVTVDKTSELGYHVGKTKTGEERTVPISNRLYEMLERLKAEREDKLSVKDENGNVITAVNILPHGYIFCRDGDCYQPIYPTEVTRWTAKFVKRHNLQNVSPHDLRHTAATLALESGADLRQVQELLGHRDPTTTMQFYAGVSEEGLRRANQGIENLIVAK